MRPYYPEGRTVKTFEKIANANVDHYNNHKTAHNTITAVYAIAAVAVINSMAKRLAKNL